MASTTPRIVVAGAGLVGCALAEALTRRGHRQVTVLAPGARDGDDDAGARDPGLVRQASSSRMLRRLAVATRDAWAGQRAGGAALLARSGSLDVATTRDGLDDLRRRHGLAAATGIGSRLLDPEECAAVHPLLDAGRVLGGLHVPGDGTVEPAAVTRALSRAAAGRGAVFLGHRSVTAVERRGGRVTAVRCGAERIPADIVVSCAGPATAAAAGLGLELATVVRQYATTDPLGPLETIHALESASGRSGPLLPVLGLSGARVRAHGHRIGIGATPHRERAAEPGPPAERRLTTEEFDDAWDAAARVLPLLTDSKVAEGADVVVTRTPDGLPLLGEHPDLDGFWVAEAVRTAHAGGIADALAEWITTGRPALDGEPLDLTDADVGRFRPGPPSPFRARRDELRPHGAATDPLWFDANGSLPEVCEVTGDGAAPVAGAEALVLRRAAGMVDLSGGARVEVTGPDAPGFLRDLLAGDVDRPIGHVTEALLLDDDGGVLAAPTVVRLGAQRFLLLLDRHRDLTALRRHARGEVAVTDVGAGTAALGVWGPLACGILGGAAGDPGGCPEPGRAARLTVGAVPVTGLRISRAGEDGLLLVCAAADAEPLWDTVHAAGARYGLVAVGRLAFDALRLAAGDPGPELSPEHGPDALGLGDRVDRGTGRFPGRAAVHALRVAGGPARRLATLVLDGTGTPPNGQEPVRDLPEVRRHSRDPVPMDPAPDLRRGPVIGRVSAAGHPAGIPVVRAWLPAGRAVAGTRVEIEVLGRRRTATVVGR